MSDGAAALTARQVQAIRLIDCGTRMRLTHLGNTLVSAQAKGLLQAGLIRYAPESWIAYELTPSGKVALAQSLIVDPRD